MLVTSTNRKTEMLNRGYRREEWWVVLDTRQIGEIGEIAMDEKASRVVLELGVCDSKPLDRLDTG